jgi:hypothetical protein
VKYLHRPRDEVSMASPDRPTAKPPTHEPDLPELSKLRAFDREQHVKKGIEAGMTREEAERHADEDLRERDDAHP